MEDVKNWYQSKTVWASIVAVLATLLNASGLMPYVIGETEIDLIVNVILSLVAGISSIVAVYGRFTASKQIK